MGQLGGPQRTCWEGNIPELLAHGEKPACFFFKKLCLTMPLLMRNGGCSHNCAQHPKRIVLAKCPPTALGAKASLPRPRPLFTMGMCLL